MASVRNLIVIIVVLNILKRVSCDYPCICNYHVELTVTNSPDDKGTLIGYMYEFDCKPQAFVKDLDSKWLAVAFEKKLGYVQKDEQVQIQKCPGNQPEEDKLPTTTTVATTPFTTLMQSTITSPYTTTTRLSSTPSTTTTESTVTTTLSPTTTQSTVHITPSLQSSVPVTAASTTTQQTVITTPSTTTTQSTVPTSKSVTTTLSTLPITTSTTTIKTTTTTTKQSTVPSTTSTTTGKPIVIKTSIPTTTQLKVTTIPFMTTATQQPNGSVQAPHRLFTVSVHTSYCQDDSFHFGHFCYKIVTTPTFWAMAGLICQNISGGHLLSITNANEEEYIYQLLNEFNVSGPLWTGLNDQLQEGMFQWSSGDSDYNNYNVLTWSQGMKTPHNSDDDCVVIEAINYPMTIDDINCASRHAYICKYQANSHPSTSQASSTMNPGGVSSGPDTNCNRQSKSEFLRIENLYFEYVSNPTSWQKAKHECIQCGGSLAEIHNAKQDDELSLFLQQRHSNEKAWIGLKYVLSRNQHAWISGTSVGYTNWHQMHDKISTNHYIYNCVVINQDGLWEEVKCDEHYEEHPFFCMYDLGDKTHSGIDNQQNTGLNNPISNIFMG